jgi:hypothetical protein
MMVFPFLFVVSGDVQEPGPHDVPRLSGTVGHYVMASHTIVAAQELRAAVGREQPQRFNLCASQEAGRHDQRGVLQLPKQWQKSANRRNNQHISD